MDELRANPEVLYGAAIALLIVVLLTPAVGGMARLLGVVDNPDERPPTVASGVRIGTPAATMRGFDEDDFREVGRIIVGALADGADVSGLAARSEALCDKRPLYDGFRGYTSY